MDPFFTNTSPPTTITSSGNFDTSNSIFSVDDPNFQWYTSIEDNLEAQKLLAAAIAHNDQYRFDEDQKRKLEALEDIVQQSPAKASHNLNVASVPHPEISAEESNQSTPENVRSDQPSEPQKKKPGRKPLNNTPSSKRKAQNRAAQRAFRERKERYVKELETKITELESLSAKSVQENQQLKSLVDQLQTENFILKQTSFSFEFPLTKTGKSATSVDKNIMDLMSSSSPPSNQQQFTSDITKSLLSISGNLLDPYTPPSSGTSDEEPGETSDKDSSTANTNIVNSSTKTTSESKSDSINTTTTTTISAAAAASPTSNATNTTKNVLSNVLKSSKPHSSSHSPKPQSAKEFCDKFTDGICQGNSIDEEVNSTTTTSTKTSNSITGSNRLSSFTEYRDPTPFTPNIDNPFSESTPLPPLFEDNFQDFGSFAPMATPIDERKNPFGNHHLPMNSEEAQNKKFLSCNKVWERIQQHPRFDDLEGDEIDQLCKELKSKAKCSGNGPVVPEEELEAVLVKLEDK